ncbi:MAG: hypothetical protein ABI950_01800 [Solirubrobacteraceae bacterium]
MRTLLLVVAVVFVAVLLALTIHALIQSGPDILTVFSVLVLALFAFGIVGALLHPPGE